MYQYKKASEPEPCILSPPFVNHRLYTHLFTYRKIIGKEEKLQKWLFRGQCVICTYQVFYDLFTGKKKNSLNKSYVLTLFKWEFKHGCFYAVSVVSNLLQRKEVGVGGLATHLSSEQKVLALSQLLPCSPGARSWVGLSEASPCPPHLPPCPTSLQAPVAWLAAA